MPNGQIDPAKADADWEQNTAAPEGSGGKLVKARLAYTTIKARLADLQYRQLMGDLLPRAEVQVAAFKVTRQIRDACQNIPARCCGAISGEVRRSLEAAGLAPAMVDSVAARLSLVEVDNLLSAEIRTILNDLADGLAFVPEREQ